MGLKQHAGREGKSSQCNRHQKQTKKAENIKKDRARTAERKKTKVSDVKLEDFDGKIPRHTQYTSLAKTICLNLIRVRHLIHSVKITEICSHKKSFS